MAKAKQMKINGTLVDLIGEYDDTEIKQDISTLNENLSDLQSTKVGYSEVIGSQLLMYSDSTKEHLLATLDLPSGGGVSDVKVNGNSFVTDGVANIPLGSGITILSNKLQVEPSSNNRINSRTNYFPITGGQIDYAVKASMCDGKGSAWSETEQANARARLGIYPEEGVMF